MRVAVDAMGGDHAPRALVAGALEATRADDSLQVLLVGRRQELEAEIQEQGGAGPNLEVVHAEQVIAGGDRPVEAVRREQDASIRKALELVRAGRADAVVAAGSTGAIVAAAQLVLKPLPGVKRPGIAVPLPSRTTHGNCLLVDVGATPDARPQHLYQFGLMGREYVRGVYGIDEPRVGVLSTGTGDTRGTSVVQEAMALLRSAPIDFVGAIEGRDLFNGACEVAVVDGFVGNVLLKATEGCADFLFGLVSEVVAPRNPDALLSVARRVDYAELGGAPLLGADGVVIVCHGRSDARAISNAIREAVRAIEHDVNATIVRGLAADARAREASA